jgi:small subunit ribosomal protein S17
MSETNTTPARGSHRKVREGLVVSDKMQKTVVVEVEDRVKHALYGKVVRRTTKLKAHDESDQVGIGDRVLIMETRPLSATKRWRVVEVEDRVKHALYGKVMRRTVKLKAHDEANECGIGDRVQVMETRPLSATKRWRVVSIVEKAK